MALEANWLATPTEGGLAVDANHVYWTNADGIGRATLDLASVDPTWVSIPAPKWVEEQPPGAGAGFMCRDSSALYFHIYWSGNASEEEPDGILTKFGRVVLDGTGLDRFWLAHPDPWESIPEGLNSSSSYGPPFIVANGYVYFAQPQEDAENHTLNRIARAPLADPINEATIEWDFFQNNDGFYGNSFCVAEGRLYFITFEEKIGSVALDGTNPIYPWRNLTGANPHYLAAGGDGFIYWVTETGVVGRKAIAEGGITQGKLFAVAGIESLAVGNGYLYFTTPSGIGRWELSTAKVASSLEAISTLMSLGGPPLASAGLNLTPTQVDEAQRGLTPAEAEPLTLLERLYVLTDSGYDFTQIAAILNITPEAVIAAQAWPGPIGEGEEPPEREELTVGAYTLNERIIILTEAGMTFSEIAVLLNVAPADVEAVLVNNSVTIEEVPPEEGE